MAVKPVPEGYNTVSAYLIVKDPDKALEFYAKAFGAEAGSVMRTPGGGPIMHADMRLGNSTFMLSAENPQWQNTSAETLGGSPVSLHIYVADVDKAYERAVAAGCTATMPVMDAFWGDRYGKLKDPFGLEWGIATHKEDLSVAEIEKRAAAWFASMEGGNCS